jgi:hypothetical protein
MRLLRHVLSRPECSSFAERNETTNNEVAMEGLFSDTKTKVQEFFDHAEQGPGYVDSRRNMVILKRLQSKISSKKAVRDDATPIELTHYARWMIHNKKIITDANYVIKELERIREVIMLFHIEYIPRLTKVANYVATEVLGCKDSQQAIKNFQTTGEMLYPPEFNKLFTVIRESQHYSKKLKATPNFFGDWYVSGLVMAGIMPPTKALILAAELDRNKESIVNGSWEAWQPEQVKKILDALEKINSYITFDRDLATALGNIHHALDKFEKQHDEHYDSYDQPTRDLLNRLWRTGDSILNREQVIGLVNTWTEHVTSVFLKLCEGSIRRMR